LLGGVLNLMGHGNMMHEVLDQFTPMGRTFTSDYRTSPQRRNIYR
jgi:hypothetical protein